MLVASQDSICTARRASRHFTGGACFVLAFAGAGKLLDLVAFQDSLATWRLLPEWLRWIVVMALPIAEMSCLLLWSTPRRRLAGEWLALFLAIAMLLTSGLHVLLGEKPTCNCLGVLDQYFRFMASTKTLVWKSAAIGALLVAGMWLKAIRQPAEGGSP